jgi:hypothetical protein
VKDSATRKIIDFLHADTERAVWFMAKHVITNLSQVWLTTKSVASKFLTTSVAKLVTK